MFAHRGGCRPRAREHPRRVRPGGGRGRGRPRAGRAPVARRRGDGLPRRAPRPDLRRDGCHRRPDGVRTGEGGRRLPLLAGGRHAPVPRLAASRCRRCATWSRATPECRLIVELKDDSAALAKAAVEVVREAGALERVCFGSFFGTVLGEVRRLAPAATTSGSRSEVFWAVMASRLGLLPPFRRYRALQVPEQRENIRVVTPGFVRAARRAGVPVQVWIVDRPDDIRRLLELGVDRDHHRPAGRGGQVGRGVRPRDISSAGNTLVRT